MFAIVSSGSKQYRADLGCSLVLDRMNADVGSVVSIKDVLLVANGQDVMPVGKDSVVNVEILEHFKGEKCIIFKKRRRKNYERKNGFRASYTKVLVKEIKA